MDETLAWYETPHVGAFHRLQEIGFHTDPECFGCHTTGFGYETGFMTRERSPMLSGVTCEACHGPASRDVHDLEGYGGVDESTCLGCHDAQRDPDFDSERMIPLIRHAL